MRKVYYVYVLLSSTILGAGNAMAECVATPDCEKLGYTETSCAEGGVKCPWDTTKLFCGPSCSLTTTKAQCDANCQNVGSQSCSKNGVTYYAGCGTSKCTTGQSCVNGSCACDSIYKYTCTGTGYASGSGSSCGGKYTSCNCATNYVWSSGACSCNGTFKYTCSGTGYAGGSGSACGGKYASCSCASAYQWNGSACTCKSEYKYTCSGTGYAGGAGTACGGKYASCNCSSGYNWDGSSCAQTCVVGSILNSDMSCSASKVSGKTPIGVVSYVNGSKRIAINLDHTNMQWGGYGTDIPGLTNYSSSPHTTDFNGKSNTSKIVSALGSGTGYAAGYCNAYSKGGVSGWYLPAQGELYASVWTNKSTVDAGLSAAGGTSIQSGWYWSSSEYSSYSAWCVGAYSGTVDWGHKTNNYHYVRCVLPFEDNGGGTAKVCDKDYKYTCAFDSSTHISGGSGISCGGLYKSCTCRSGYEWKDGKCVVKCEVPWNETVCDSTNTCCVGDILYSDKTCSKELISSKTPIGVVSYINGSKRIAISLKRSTSFWSKSYVDISGIPNYSSSSSALQDFNGKSNTAAWVNHYGSSATNGAPGYCYNYTTAGTRKGDWYLPALGELSASIWTYHCHVNTGLANIGDSDILGSGYAWSSSEYAGEDRAWIMRPSANDAGDTYKEVFKFVWCVLEF